MGRSDGPAVIEVVSGFHRMGLFILKGLRGWNEWSPEPENDGPALFPDDA